MNATRVRPVRRTGQILTGFGALVLLVGLVAGAPIALLAFAGNPLPDHLPTIAEIGDVLTSRDDGQLFVRALALVGWAGWATFTLSVLVELPARVLRRPAVRLPGMRPQQRAAAALVGSIALIIAASPAATAATAAAAPAPQTVAAAPQIVGAAPHTVGTEAGPVRYPTLAPGTPTGLTAVGPHQALAMETGNQPAQVYRVAKGDYLGHVADRYLGDFEEYRDLAKLNGLRHPDRIRPGQLLRLPENAVDHGVRPHATGKLTAPTTPKMPTRPTVPPPPTAAGPTAPATPDAPPAPARPPAERTEEVSFAGGASRPVQRDSLNRPLAVSAVIAVASIVGAQVGAVLGLRRRTPASVRAGARGGDSGRHRHRD